MWIIFSQIPGKSLWGLQSITVGVVSCRSTTGPCISMAVLSATISASEKAFSSTCSDGCLSGGLSYQHWSLNLCPRLLTQASWFLALADRSLELAMAPPPAGEQRQSHAEGAHMLMGRRRPFPNWEGRGVAVPSPAKPRRQGRPGSHMKNCLTQIMSCWKAFFPARSFWSKRGSSPLRERPLEPCRHLRKMLIPMSHVWGRQGRKGRYSETGPLSQLIPGLERQRKHCNTSL